MRKRYEKSTSSLRAGNYFFERSIYGSLINKQTTRF